MIHIFSYAVYLAPCVSESLPISHTKKHTWDFQTSRNSLEQNAFWLFLIPLNCSDWSQKDTQMLQEVQVQTQLGLLFLGSGPPAIGQ